MANRCDVFRLSTFKQFDGTLPGDYRVCMTWLSDAIKQDGENVGPIRLRRAIREVEAQGKNAYYDRWYPALNGVCNGKGNNAGE